MKSWMIRKADLGFRGGYQTLMRGSYLPIGHHREVGRCDLGEGMAALAYGPGPEGLPDRSTADAYHPASGARVMRRNVIRPPPFRHLTTNGSP